MQLLGVDVGGTFTDVVMTDTTSGRIEVHKVASTPNEPARAVLRGLQELCASRQLDGAAIEHVLHGTTVATNAVIERRGVEAGLITTAGFRDLIHIGRHQRPQHYSIMQDIPWQAHPLVKRRHRKAVTERLVPPHGDIAAPLDERAVREAALALRDAGVESLAVCFLFSYLNSDHECRAKAIIEAACPELFVTTSHEVAAQFREFERFTSTAMNAYIGPLVARYVRDIETELAQCAPRAELHIMRSSGGAASAATVSELPVCTLMSGLAAGILGGAYIAQLAGRENAITLDIGGTSADIGVVTRGRIDEASARDTFVGGYPIMVPMLDLHTLGAGGGSIAYVDDGGAFRVGPRSAGAVPGPAAYARGGCEATITDANLILGRLDPEHFLGGEMRLDLGAAERAFATVATRLRLSVVEAAAGAISILNANMANAIRARTVQKGIDPRDYVLVAAGGAGPLHAAEIARQLDIPEVVVPPYPGINSAMGLLTTDLKYDLVQTALMLSNALDCDRLNAAFAAMESRLSAQLHRDHIAARDIELQRAADVRYAGQGYELRIVLPRAKFNDRNLLASLATFHDLHASHYGHCWPDAILEIVNIRSVAIGRMPQIVLPQRARELRPRGLAPTMRPALFRINESLREVPTAFYDRDALSQGETVAGPAVILQADSTTVVPPDAELRVANHELLLMRLR